MRVIAGSARRLPLKTIEGLDTRPTTDRIKETLFNMLQNSLPGCRFLDLFSGSGAIGIEALSRGAEMAVFVEDSQKAAACIRENLKTTRLEENAMVMNCDVLTAIGRLKGKQQVFDMIFMDPPYNMGLEQQALEGLKTSGLIDEDTLIIIEASKETSADFIEEMGYEVTKEKVYKTNKHIFVRYKGEH